MAAVAAKCKESRKAQQATRPLLPYCPAPVLISGHPTVLMNVDMDATWKSFFWHCLPLEDDNIGFHPSTVTASSAMQHVFLLNSSKLSQFLLPGDKRLLTVDASVCTEWLCTAVSHLKIEGRRAGLP